MIAFVREVARSLGACELTYLTRGSIDADLAARQHAGYVRELQRLGCHLQWLTPLPEQPDGVFVEDTAVLLPEVAVVMRPGVESRRGEVDSVAAELARRLPLGRITAPATLEGGDVLRIEHRLYVGVSGRSNASGVEQLRTALQPYGYEVHAVPMRGCLHLKSACTYIPPGVLLANPSWVDPSLFAPRRVIAVDEGEPFAANTLTIDGVTLVSEAYPRTRQCLESAGIDTCALEVSELHKAEAALTCLSLLL